MKYFKINVISINYQNNIAYEILYFNSDFQLFTVQIDCVELPVDSLVDFKVLGQWKNTKPKIAFDDANYEINQS